MATLHVTQGPQSGQSFVLGPAETVAGRQRESVAIFLPGSEVSRHHARFLFRDGTFWVEDLDSRNGTFVNEHKIHPKAPFRLQGGDDIRIGPHVLHLQIKPQEVEPNLVVREKLTLSLNESVYGQDPAQKLQIVLELAQHLARTLDIEPLLERLLEYLLRLFPQADHAMVVLCEGDNLVVKGQRSRYTDDATFPFSRTIIRHALEEGVGLLTEDAKADRRFQASNTLLSLKLHSVLCVPLIAQDGQRLGVLQVDHFRVGLPFTTQDLQLLTTIALQVAVMLQYAGLHAERLRQVRLMQELALARHIQQSALPGAGDSLPSADLEILGRVFPAYEMAGDFYDFLPLSENRLAFFIGDVAGKGLPAALFLVAARTLCRHLVKTADSPAQVLRQLNDTLAATNASCQFVTLAHGTYDSVTGEIVLVSAGHPPPLLRHADGLIEEVALKPARPLGIEEGHLRLHEVHLVLQPGQLLMFYTDGLVEARIVEQHLFFGLEKTMELLKGFDNSLSLVLCAERARQAVQQFTHTKELQDDLTLLLLRRKVL